MLLHKKHGYKDPLILREDEISLVRKYDVEEDAAFVYLDDCCYSGIQINSRLNNNVDNKMDIHILLPFISEDSIDKIISISSYFRIYKGVTITGHFERIITDLRKRFDNIQDYIDMYYYFACSYRCKNIYFDHKIAGPDSTFDSALLMGPIIGTYSQKLFIGSFGPLFSNTSNDSNENYE